MNNLTDAEATAFLEEERLKAEAAAANEPPPPEIPPDTKPVIYVNHNGIEEKAVVLSMNGNLANLFIQGAHKNDKYKISNVRLGGPYERCTYHNLPVLDKEAQ